ncbi:hypothetical protein HMPREF3185_00505 [Porphyromonas somerae]|uniref:Uncharacterized protein n=1 Tax=Porphyromonas somerae TaxID=322095 RepID=A0A134BCA0_9PORP|nr:hypothetical protein HMPREF3184_00505 [Porphyromonadaceae bacterium KA00676]KXB77582.1 hypothetical protein HMPREF3185_00505 [Porphyromonas somerae]
MPRLPPEPCYLTPLRLLRGKDTDTSRTPLLHTNNKGITPPHKATGPLPKDIGSDPVKRYSAKRRIT